MLCFFDYMLIFIISSSQINHSTLFFKPIYMYFEYYYILNFIAVLYFSLKLIYKLKFYTSYLDNLCMHFFFLFISILVQILQSDKITLLIKLRGNSLFFTMLQFFTFVKCENLKKIRLFNNFIPKISFVQTLFPK